MSRHLRILAACADGPRSVNDLYRTIPRDAYLGSAAKDLVREGFLALDADYRYVLTPAGLDRLARSPEPRVFAR